MKGIRIKILSICLAIIAACGISIGIGIIVDNSPKEDSSIGATQPTNTSRYWSNGNRPTGDGSSGNPYLISTAEELNWIAHTMYTTYSTSSYAFSGVYFKQTAVIDLSAYWWQPIGASTYYLSGSWHNISCSFAGIYDGGGYKIKGCFPKTSSNQDLGVFGRVAGQGSVRAEIKNLAVVDSYVSGSNYLGGIVGSAQNCLIRNCYFKGTVTRTSTSNYGCGGIVGNLASNGTIANCFNFGTSDVGGIVGLGSGFIYNCYNTGNISPYGKNGGSRAYCYNDSDSNIHPKLQSWYTTASNWNASYSWDFPKTWRIYSVFNDGYPCFAQEALITIKFDQQLGSGGVSQITCYYDAAFHSLASTPQRAGYTFQGYYTQPNGRGTKYFDYQGSPASSFLKNPFTSTTTLYAYWEGINITITFDRQGGTGGPSSISCKYGDSFTRLANVPTKTGYDFYGYYTQINGGGTRYFTGSGAVSSSVSTCTFTSNTTLYAWWDLKTITITFDSQGGTGGPSSVSYQYGDSLIRLASTPQRTGYSFQGYYTEKNGGGTQYFTGSGSLSTPGSTCTFTSNTTLYAHWSLIPCWTNINVLNPDGVEDNQSAYFDLYIHDTAGVYTGTYTDLVNEPFTSTGGDMYLGFGSTIKVYNIRSYEANKYKVASVTSQGTITDNDDGSYTYLVDRVEGAIIIQMERTDTKLVLNLNGGNVNGSSGNIEYTQKINTTRTLPVPTREGYTFKGWRVAGGSRCNNSIGNLGVPFSGDNFFTSQNNLDIYNNLHNGNVVLTRESATLLQSPYNSHVLKISNKGAASPGLGGFSFGGIASYANAEFIAIIEGKIPVGYSIGWYSNLIGQDYYGENKWLTSNVGTGDWETYVFYVKCGSSGTFETTNYFVLNGTAGTAENPVNWYLSQASVYDCTGMGLNKDTIVSNLSKQTTYTYGTKDTTLVAVWETDIWTRHASTSFAGGDGTASNPYQIANASQLAIMSKKARSQETDSAHYKLIADIDLSGHEWEPIGWQRQYYFRGKFDGGLHTISNMKILLRYDELYGLISCVYGGRVEKVIIQNANIRQTGAYVKTGAIAGLLDAGGVIENCIVKNSTLEATNILGGIVGWLWNSNITNCLVINNTIKSSIYAGGLFGYQGGAASCILTNNGCYGNTITGSSAGVMYSPDSNKGATYNLNGSYAQGNVNGTESKVMYGDSTQWGNWTYNIGINNGYPVQSGLFWIGGQTGSVNVYNYLKNTLGFSEG